MKKNLRTITLTLILTFPCAFSHAQIFINRNMQQAYDQGTRSMDGQPGKNYWQNRGDYDLNVSFNPKTLLLSGEETIAYFNNSPDTLHKLIFHLFPDYYKRGTFRNYPVAEKDENDGVTIEQLEVAGKSMIGKPNPNGKSSSDSVNDKLASIIDNPELTEGTNLIIKLKEPLLSRTKTIIHVRWYYTLNSGSQNRTGQVDSTSFFIAYCFPRIAVYDDVDGWDDASYKGIQEFYNDFGNFNASITVPKGYMIWATGDLQNEQEVLSPNILSKLHQAENSSQITHVIDSPDYKNGIVTTANAMNTFKFSATNVTDFVFALSNHYLWDVCSIVADKNSGRKVLVETAFNKNHKDYFDVINQAKRSVQIMSDTFPAVPFPFPHITVFDGTDQMEYPMMVNDNPTETRTDAVQLTSHEIFHSYFPFYMGINETQYAWMDEGWATIGESVISPMLGEPEDEGIYSRGRFERNAGTDKDVPMITNSKLQSGIEYYSNSYGKPGLCYWILRDLLGDEKFFKALHAYMDAWNGKHPTPYDFFFIFNKSSGENLDWFWKAWFFDWGYPDLSIKEVKMDPDKSGGKWKIVVEKKGNIPVPVTLDITLKDGSVIHHHETAEVWKDGSTVYIFRTKTQSEIQSVKLGDIYTPDVDRKDNVWKP
ncbi:MAG TPA: M1 family metallopeptidase [Chitinophagales bacterium]|nr:M1 family metallopeptidase [Chitinophagales bacterium]